jgi:TolB protein
MIQEINTGVATPLLPRSILQEVARKTKGQVQMTYAPHVSPDRTRVCLALIIDGKSAIYIYNSTTQKLIQLTQHIGIDTSPCFSPDGSKIIFTSDREGQEAIYSMNIDGSGVTRISSPGGKYSAPACSPLGNLIAFVKQIRGQFHLGLMNLDGSEERLIAVAYLIETPCWAPNGLFLICSIQMSPTELSKLAITNVQGTMMHFIKTPGDATWPAWVPCD